MEQFSRQFRLYNNSLFGSERKMRTTTTTTTKLEKVLIINWCEQQPTWGWISSCFFFLWQAGPQTQHTHTDRQEIN